MEVNKIYNENCLDTMAKMPDNFIDLTVTSPPYDNLRDYKGYSFPFEEIAKVGKDVTYYRDGKISPAFTYFYRVKAFSEENESLYSNETSQMLVVFAPSSLIAVAVSPTQNDLQWIDNSNNETGFVIERSGSFDSGFSQIGEVGSDVVTYSDTTAISGKTYYYRVKAISSGGDSGYSNVISSNGPTINPPTNLIAVSGNGDAIYNINDKGKITLSWIDNSNNEIGFAVEDIDNHTTGYYQEVLITPGDSIVGDVHTITIANLEVSHTYRFRIRAFNGSTVSDYSNEALAVVPTGQ